MLCLKSALLSDKNLMNEDMQRMKELFNFKSQDTLGNLKGSERLNENKQFDTIWNKTKNINEMTGGFGFTGEGNMEGMKPMSMEEEEIEEKVPHSAQEPLASQRRRRYRTCRGSMEVATGPVGDHR